MMAHWNSTPHLAQGSPAPIIDPDMVTVYNMRFCPFAERTMLVLIAKQVPFQVININLKNKPDWFLKQTAGKVPVVLHKGKVILESLDTCNYLDEKFPAVPLHPAEERRKANDVSLVESFTGSLASIYKVNISTSQEDRQENFKEVVKMLQEINSVLKIRGGTFIGGESPAMSDLMIWPWMERIAAYPILFPGEDLTPPSNLENFNKWIVAMMEVPAVKVYRLKPEELATYTRTNKDGEAYDMFLTTK